MEVDFGRTADDYGRHREGFPAELADRLVAATSLTEGELAVDLGTGTGSLARLLSARGAWVLGIDPAVALLEQGRALDAAAGTAMRYVVGLAEDVCVRTGSVDLLTAGQCWHWFDRPRAAAEARRVLRDRGHLAICHFDWIPVGDNIVRRTEDLILRHNGSWAGAGGTGIHPRWTRDVSDAGFVDVTTFSFDRDVLYSHQRWRGRVRASAGVGGSLEPSAVEHFDDALAEMLAAEVPDPFDVPHRVWALVCRSPSR